MAAADHHHVHASKVRRNTTMVAWLCYLVTIPFLILVEIGSTYNKPVLRQIYFFRLNVAHIIPISVSDHYLLNSVARSLGLHDFYQTGLFSFCDGYNSQGVTHCSQPEQFYWFDPIKILISELLSGATIALPIKAVSILKVLRVGSHVMYGFFLSGTAVNFALLLATPLAVRSRWYSLPLSLGAAVAAILVDVATIIATAISVAFKYALTSEEELNIQVDIGVRMFAFMWTASAFTTLAFFLHAAMGCCCKSRRDNSLQEKARGDGTAMQQRRARLHAALPRMVVRKRLQGSISSGDRSSPSTGSI